MSVRDGGTLHTSLLGFYDHSYIRGKCCVYTSCSAERGIAKGSYRQWSSLKNLGRSVLIDDR